MTIYTCETCKQDFKQKNDYTRHINKKFPCVTQEKLKEMDINEITELKEKINENDSLKQLESFFLRLRNILRDNENITGDKSLDVITDFLFLRLLNYELESNKEMNLISKKYNEKVKIDKEFYDIDEYKKYFKWSELMQLVENIDADSKDQESKLLLTNVIQHIIFNGIFKFNENTKEIYRNRRFYVKKTLTIIKLLKEFNKIELDKFDVDVKGKAYELTLQKEGATNKDFSQFFTPRWIDKYMVLNAEIKIKSDGSFTKIMDPACGTAGILTEYLSEIKEKGKKEKINIDKNISKYIYGNEIVDDTLKIAHMNMLLKSGTYNTNLKCVDFLEAGCFDWEEDKFDGNIIMNPPFALTKTYNLSDKESKKVFPVETKSGTMLFLMASLNTIKKGRQLIMVSQNGKEIYNKNKEYVNIRKHTVDNANLYKIAMLPEGSFKPYTSVQTLILMMKKGEKTKEIQFVNLTKNKDDVITETEICKVKYEELEKKNYSWDYRDYYTNNLIQYDNVKYFQVDDICQLKNGKNITKECLINGEYAVIGGGQKPMGYHNEYNLEENEIIMSKDGEYAGYISMYPNKIYLTGHGINIKIINDIIDKKYFYYYLKTKQEKLYEFQKGSAQPGIDKEAFNKMKIPVPPISIQNLIIKELDSMYKQKENLQTAINEMDTFRKAKFEMLLFECKDKKTIKLGAVSEINYGTRILKANAGEKYPVYGGGDITFYYNEYNRDNETLIISRFACSKKCVRIINGKLYLNDSGMSLHANDKITQKYLNKYCFYISEIIYGCAIGSAQKNMDIEKFKNIQIQLPSLQDQEKIVQQMEVFDTLVNLQQKQIEELDHTIKERFDFHLKKCESVINEDDKTKSKDDLEKDLEELESDSEPIKKNKKDSKVVKGKKTEKPDSENESDKSEKPIESKTIKSKSKSKSKSNITIVEDESDEESKVKPKKSSKNKKE